jgi:rhomboid family GlyGly-CTERM serine protease
MKIRVPFLTLTLSALACALAALPGAATALQLDRAARGVGALHRGLTAHLVHFNANHLAWDVAALLLLGGWVETLSPGGMRRTLLLSAVAISAAVWFFQPQFSCYRGLSGLDSALAGFAIAYLFRHARAERDGGTALIAAAAALGFAGKSVFELTTGGTLFTEPNADFAAVPLAHLVGFVTGAGIGSLQKLPSSRGGARRADEGIPTGGSATPGCPGLAMTGDPGERLYSPCTITRSSMCRLQYTRSPSWKASCVALSLATSTRKRVP